jgi:hypothetical protein
MVFEIVKLEETCSHFPALLDRQLNIKQPFVQEPKLLNFLFVGNGQSHSPLVNLEPRSVLSVLLFSFVWIAFVVFAF